MKFKKLVSMAVATAVAFSFATVVMADTEKNVLGEGLIGFYTPPIDERTISPTFAKVEATDVKVGGTNAIKTSEMENKPGAQIVVQWPNTSYGESIVDSQGEWRLGVPYGMTLNDGESLYAWQRVSGYQYSFATKVVVGSGEDGKPDPTKPDPEVPDKPGGMEDFITITMPSTFYWRVDQDSHPNVTSSKHTIVTSGIDWDGQHFDPAVEVSFVSVIKTNDDADNIASNLELYFTDDFGNQALLNQRNISNGYEPANPILIKKIVSGTSTPGADTITYGFNGRYNAGLPASNLVPTYVMKLHFRTPDGEDDGFLAEFGTP